MAGWLLLANVLDIYIQCVGHIRLTGSIYIPNVSNTYILAFFSLYRIFSGKHVLAIIEFILHNDNNKSFLLPFEPPLFFIADFYI